ncbi:hypothetical protein MG293_014270 [Ovis ammon polii]|uniref:Uncharacterized protein n=1 Tax=Ovis ammon polii TaxID=230172 RepID=A0AAD4TXW8_OVIAM|nr:hypothetical protein MG293_014270 [Ovis ammon polii]
MINSRRPFITQRRHMPVFPVVPLEIFLLNVPESGPLSHEFREYGWRLREMPSGGEVTFKETGVHVVGDADLWCFCIISAKHHFRNSLSCSSGQQRVLQIWRQEQDDGVTCRRPELDPGRSCRGSAGSSPLMRGCGVLSCTLSFSRLLSFPLLSRSLQFCILNLAF